VWALDKSKQWRKLLLTWSSYLKPLLEVANEDGQQRLLTIFKEANSMGSNTTGDPVYSSNNIPILQKLIDLDGKHKRFEAQGIHWCELGQAFSFLNNDIEEMACYLRACEIGNTHGIFSSKCVGNLGVGRIFVRANRVLDAKPMLRLAFEATQSEDSHFMKHHALICLDELCDVLFETNSIDELGQIVKQFRTLLEKVLVPGSPRLQNYHMRDHILIARLFEAKSRPEEAVKEMYKMLSLIKDNKDCIHDWRPLFLHLIDEALRHLRILDDTDIGDFQLAKAVYSLRDEQRLKDARYKTAGV
jgi:hypothetical protein